LYYSPKAKKKKEEEEEIPSNLGSQFPTLGGQTTSPNMLKVGPKFY
jgi:hypothetical protein